MKAVVCTRYGPADVLQVQEVEKPSPKENEACIEVRSVAVATEDPLNRREVPLFARVFTGFRKPKNPILGAEFAGVVESVGTAVKRFKEGQAVFGSTGTAYGCYAEYVCVPEDGFLAMKPSSMTYEEAAPVMELWRHGTS
jgi:NADPH:quinone reductase-like Zn-dependent oxidoreductase